MTGELAIVLHTHMPYVVGHGTWPFGEEWLWEAIATSYLPLLDVLERAPFTFSITPVLCEQLVDDRVPGRFRSFLDAVRTETHRRDAATLREAGTGREELLPEIERSAADYRAAGERFDALGGDLLAAFAPYVSWTSSATHAILPLLVSDLGVEFQVATGVDSYRRRFGNYEGGFWLPECAYAPWLDRVLLESGVHHVCVDLTDVYGYGAPEQLRPLRTAEGLTLVPLDRSSFELAWSDRGYPGASEYRDHHALTTHHHRVWANDGSPYDRERALGRARSDAADFVTRVLERLERGARELGRTALCVCAFDTEFFGHWWFEGPAWLAAVAEEAERQGLTISQLDDALTRFEPVLAPPELPITSWGQPRDLTTWDGPRTRELAWRVRKAEQELLAHWPEVPERAVTELLALQASDWAFLVTRDTAGEYPQKRSEGHLRAFNEAISSVQE